MNTPFTPGPWRPCGHDRGLCKCGQIWSIPQDFQIATVHQSNEMQGEISEEQFRATVHLVSAAPDLYEALKEVVAISDRKHDAWDRAKAALLKAKGGNP